MSPAHLQPRTVEQAVELLGRYAEVDARRAGAEAARKDEIGRINAAADVEVAPLLDELAAIAAAVRPWWEGDGQALATGTRKSVQLGGCMIGTRALRARLTHGFKDEDAAVEALRATRYGKQTTRVKWSLDRAAALKLVQGTSAAGKALVDLGFRAETGEQFFLERVEQAGTIAGG